jgi:hypothetical protein
MPELLQISMGEQERQPCGCYKNQRDGRYNIVIGALASWATIPPFAGDETRRLRLMLAVYINSGTGSLGRHLIESRLVIATEGRPKTGAR